MYSLGIDVGSSSIKVSLLDIEQGICVTSSTNPRVEMPISAPEKGFAEQNPEMAREYGIMQAPTLVITDGEHMKKYVNASNIQRYVDEEL